MLYSSDAEGLAWLQASNEAWAARVEAAYDDAVSRGEAPAAEGSAT